MTNHYPDLTHYLADLAAKKSTPGGGAVAAITGAQAAALIEMVAVFTKGLDTHPIVSEARQARETFTQLADQDVEAFATLMQAYRDKLEVEDALKGAAAAPLACLEWSERLAILMPGLLANGNQNLITDTGIAALLIKDTILASELNVLINLKSIKDDDFKAAAHMTINSARKKIPLLDEIAAQVRNQIIS